MLRSVFVSGLRLASLLALVTLLVAGPSAFGQPGLARAVPGAAAPGKTTDITITGSNLDQPLKVWSSFPATIEPVPGDPNAKGKTSLVCKVTLPPDAACGVGAIIVTTSAGQSDPLFLMIDDLPSVADNGNNHTVETAQEIPPQAAVDGTSDGPVFDYYKFTAKAGQRLSLEVVATRLGSDFDPVLRILGPAGQEIALIDDDLSLGADCRIGQTFPADGVYIIELRDNRYKAGGKYRLRVGDFPLVSTPFPLGVQAGGAGQVTAAGPFVNGIPAAIVAGPFSALGNRTFFSAKLPGGQSSGFAPLAVTDLTEVAENAPADNPAAFTTVVVPSAISGKLETPKDFDLFQFPAVKGTKLTFRAYTRSMYSPAILTMKLLNAAGGQLVETAVSEGEEETLSYVTTETGLFTLRVEDLLGRGGPEYSYRVEARTGNFFALNLKNEPATRTKISIPRNGGAFTLDVQVARNGYDGPITLGIDSAHMGWQVFNNVIPEKAAEVKMYVVAPRTLVDAEFLPLRIVGKATVDGREFAAAANSTLKLRAAKPQSPLPPTWLDGMVAVSALPESPMFYNVTPDKTELNFARQVGQTQLVLTFDRTDANFKDVPLTVMPLGLPAGITAEIKRNGNGPKETYDIILKGPKDMAEGRHVFRYLAYAEMAGNGRATVSGEIGINVITPLAAVVAPAGPITAGQKQKVKITLTRRGDDKQPVDVKFKKLPPGVTGPEKTTFAPDQNEMEIELSAAADAAKGNFTELAVTASTKYAGQDVTIDSPNVAIETK
ncbi:MAG: PPC domain-containing protein [Planctomycetales bacterium]|nr:PPC domain-containing protein [Planctomycetales bacterium]